RRRRGGTGAGDRACAAERATDLRLPRIPPRAGAHRLAALAAERGVGIAVSAGAGDLAVRHVAAAGISVFSVLNGERLATAGAHADRHGGGDGGGEEKDLEGDG